MNKTLLLSTILLSTSAFCQEQELDAQQTTQTNNIDVQVPIDTSLDTSFCDAYIKAVQSVLIDKNQECNLDIANQALTSASFNADGSVQYTFSYEILNNYLKQNGINTWRGLDKGILLWASNDNSSILSENNLDDYLKNVMLKAHDYKFNLFLPLMDIDDIQAVNGKLINDSYNLTSIKLAQASSRYNVDYFVTLTHENDLIKYSLYNKRGQIIGASTISTNDDPSTISANIAKLILDYQTNLQQEENTYINENDALTLGEGNGYIRVRIHDINNLEDFFNVQRTIAQYGFSGALKLIAETPEGTIVDIPTNVKPNILIGTMIKSKTFKQLTPWEFAYDKAYLNGVGIPKDTKKK